jgi:hypothetical protein
MKEGTMGSPLPSYNAQWWFDRCVAAEKQNARLRALLEAVWKVATEEMDNLGVGAYFARSVLAVLSNEGGDDG